MTRETQALNDQQVAMFVHRGEVKQLTLFQEDLIDLEGGGYQQAKSLTLTNEGIKELRDFLNTLKI